MGFRWPQCSKISRDIYGHVGGIFKLFLERDREPNEFGVVGGICKYKDVLTQSSRNVKMGESKESIRVE